MQHDILADGIEIYRGDSIELLHQLDASGAIVTDPPYGIDYEARQPNSKRYGKIIGDRIPFDPSLFLERANEIILWGANNFANALPIGGWIVWDKRCSINADRMMGSPFELAWSRKSLFRMIRIQHGGAKNADALNGDVANEPRYHPTQKPIALMIECLRLIKSRSIIDPYMGAGSTGLAAINLNRRFIGIEIEPKYYEIAKARLIQAIEEREMDMFREKVEEPCPLLLPI